MSELQAEAEEQTNHNPWNWALSILPNISISNDALDKGMVRRPDPEKHGPERGRDPFEYDKGTHSFAMHKISNNPRNQGHWRY